MPGLAVRTAANMPVQPPPDTQIFFLCTTGTFLLNSLIISQTVTVFFFDDTAVSALRYSAVYNPAYFYLDAVQPCQFPIA